MSDLLQQQFAVIESQIELLRLQVVQLRQLMRGSQAPAARVEQPARCAGVPEEKCALLDGEAMQIIGGFDDPHKWRCRGCGFRSDAQAMQ